MTQELSLRNVTVEDLPILFEHQLDAEATRMAAFPSRGHDEFMAHWAKCMADETGIHKTILFRGEVAGNIVCWQQSGQRNIGYWLGKNHWGRGIATAALTEFLRVVTIRPLYAHVVRSNPASIRVLQKCGFTKSGEEMSTGLNGEPISELIMRLE